ncbi:MAG: 23S rRNA (adenine(2503)-C(2))-methyltransferase [Chloroflexi bacterium RBG_19FT_COMBO_62_14]|nr:MAG: 23S rRNA (adenine(2503)-C(2))-methyltransferase [Chloroflexi bacterium RBG_19FT_COMBO_62_14]
MNDSPLVYDLSPDDLAGILVEWGEPAYRARQVLHALYRELVDEPSAMTSLPLKLRTRMEKHLRFRALVPRTSTESSDKNTRKVLFSMASGHSIEAVLMRYARRYTACISTQAGCGMGCVFCATGQMGFQRNLTSGEIVAQVLFFARALSTEGQHLTNVVVMGMGEPFHNYEATMQAIDCLGDPEGFNFGARRVTVSTVGLIPMIERFAAELRQVNLAVSLHAATDELRDQLLPVNRRYPLAPLIEACGNYVRQTGRRVSFEWALIAGVNDGADQAQALVKLVKGLTCHVNLIPLNPTSGFTGTATSQVQANAFARILAEAGVTCTIRSRRGIEIDAGCGQLAVKGDVRGRAAVTSGGETRPV